MVQHINLLTRHGTHKGFSWYAPRAVVLFLIGLLALAGNGELHLKRLRETQARTEQSIVDLKSSLEQKRREAGLQDIEAINAQMTALRAQAQSRQAWLVAVQKGELGTPRGYSGMFETLAQFHEEGVWLSRVQVEKGAQSMTIEGHATHSDAVMRYAEQLNHDFSALGQQFTSMEMNQDVRSGTTPAAAVSPLVNFKIF